MRITSYGHSCLLVETGTTRILVDPGTFSADDLPAVDAVLVTHQHADHAEPGRVRGLVSGGAALYVESGAAATLRAAGVDLPLQEVEVGQTYVVAGVDVEVVGGQHAVIHADIPRVGNVGYVLSAEGTRLFHPGDAYEYRPARVDVLAVPLSAPWAAVKETIEFVRAVGAPTAVPIHDGMLRDFARPVYLRHVENLGGSRVHDLAVAGPYEP